MNEFAHQKRRGFTLIELLVVIAIIGILAAALIPFLGQMMDAGADAKCRNNLLNLGRAVMTYQLDYESRVPSAGTVFYQWVEMDGSGVVHDRAGQSPGWVYVSHSCDRDGAGSENDLDLCDCFDPKIKEKGGLSPKPANWFGEDARRSISNGLLFSYLRQSFSGYVCDVAKKHYKDTLKVSDSGEQKIYRTYSMNVIASADPDVYDVKGYGDGYIFHELSARGYGPKVTALRACENDGAKKLNAAVPAKVVLFVEMDDSDSEMGSENSLAGDEVWDWDQGEELIGFYHEHAGQALANVCFADGHVETIKDPGTDAKRKRLARWYGSGGEREDGVAE